MAREDGARTKRTAGAKCVVAQYARTDIRKQLKAGTGCLTASEAEA